VAHLLPGSVAILKKNNNDHKVDVKPKHSKSDGEVTANLIDIFVVLLIMVCASTLISL